MFICCIIFFTALDHKPRATSEKTILRRLASVVAPSLLAKSTRNEHQARVRASKQVHIIIHLIFVPRSRSKVHLPASSLPPLNRSSPDPPPLHRASCPPIPGPSLPIEGRWNR